MRDLSYSRLVLNLDAVLGVNFFSIPAPGEFLKFDRAFAQACMFRIAAGETWIEELPVWTPTNEAWATIVDPSLYFSCSYRAVNWF